MQRRLDAADRQQARPVPDRRPRDRDAHPEGRAVRRRAGPGASRRPPGIPPDYAEYVQLMFDMLVLAFQTDSTRVATLLLAHDGSNRSFDQIGISEGHHDLTHHQNRKDWIEKVAEIDLLVRPAVRQVPREARQAAKDVDGNSLLHNSMIVYGSGNADGNRHTHTNLPIILAGARRRHADARPLRQARLEARDEPVPQPGRPPRA